MKDLLLIAGIGFIAYHVMQSRATQASNPTVDNLGTTSMGSVSASVPMPGTATNAGYTPAAFPTGTQAAASGSLGSDKPITYNPNPGPVAPDAVVVSNRAFERMDFINPHTNYL